MMTDDERLYVIAAQINESLRPKHMAIGAVVQHPDGRTVKIVDGAYLRNGRVSNMWTWREVKANGRLGKEESGYGW